MSVRAGENAFRARPAQHRRQQCQRRGGAEPHGVAILAPQQPRRPAQHQRCRQHQGGGMAHDLELLRGVEFQMRIPAPARRVDDQIVGRQLSGERLQIRLDTARPWREIIGNQQSSGHGINLLCRRGRVFGAACSFRRPMIAAARFGIRGYRGCAESHSRHRATNSAVSVPRTSRSIRSCAAESAGPAAIRRYRSTRSVWPYFSATNAHADHADS